MTDYKLDTLVDLARAVAGRKEASPDESYTAKLLSQGVEKCAKKFGEEAVEAALAAMTGDRKHLVSEVADVLYHLLVLLESCGTDLSDVMQELERRKDVGGIAEKRAREKT